MKIRSLIRMCRVLSIWGFLVLLGNFIAHANAPILNSAQVSIRDQILKQDSLKPWQRVILETEVLPVFQAFVRSWDGKKADVDLALLKNYIDFRCEVVGEQSSDSCDVWVLYRIEKGCQKCEQSLPGIKKVVENRLVRRGYQVVPLALDSIGISASVSPLTGQDRGWTKEKELNQKLIESAAKNKVRGIISIAVRNLPPDSPDDPHADELHFGVNAFQAFRSGVKNAEEQSRLKASSFSSFSEHLEFQIRDSVEALVERLMTEGTSQIAGRLNRAPVVSKDSVNAAESLSQEIDFELVGVRSFHHASRVRLRLESFFKETAELSFREVKYQRGRVFFVVQGLRDLDGWLESLGKVVIGDESLGETEFLDIEKTQGAEGRLMIRASLLGISKKSKTPSHVGNRPEGEL